MAEEDSKGTQNAVEASNGRAGMLSKVLIGLAVIALQVVLSFVAVKKFGLVSPPVGTAAAPVEQEVRKGDIKFGEVYLVEDVIVNPAGTSGRRFLNASVALVYNGKVGAELEKRNVQIRDILLQTLASYPMEKLCNPAFRDSLRAEILHKINGILTSGQLSGVYFSSFVMQ
ncbi:MAG: flagellar basal body-associated FliL family protein [candidate division KSB1 bacterium]|nr:flagellar basal body-associated FliL family protein [candidate division KSB1 bacterium]